MFKLFMNAMADLDFMILCTWASGFFTGVGIIYLGYLDDWAIVIGAIGSGVIYGFLSILQRREMRTAVNHAVKEEREKKTKNANPQP